MEGKASDIVIGIDFGTTYSGVSWAYPGRRDVKIVTQWPNMAAQSLDKVPSTLSYSAGKIQRWGYANQPKDEVLHWVKILLEPSHKYRDSVVQVQNSNQTLGALNKKPEEVVGDYLGLLWAHAMEDIRQEQGSDWKKNYALKVVLTVPAMWSHLARENTIQAAKLAGIPGEIKMITEPEAAALSILRDKADEDSLKTGDTFVLCDAGGGTVDLISYTIDKLKPLEISEAAKGEGGLCGSAYLNIQFEKYIETLVGKGQYAKLRGPSKRSMMKEFDISVKRVFDDENEQEYTVDLYGVEDDEENGISDNTITLSKTALKGIFDGVIGQIQTLIHNQIKAVEGRGKSVKAILLAGGFGESMYLFRRIEKMFPRLIVRKAQNAWSTICRGAALVGLEDVGGSLGRTPKITSRIARYSYGFAMSEIFNPRKHLECDKYWDPAKAIYMAKQQMTWLLKAGQSIEEGSILQQDVYVSVQVGFWDSGFCEFTSNVYCCAEENPPSRMTKTVQELCSVTYGIDKDKLWMERSYKNPETRKKWRDATMSFYIILGRTVLDFVVQYKDEIVAYTEANFLEELSD